MITTSLVITTSLEAKYNFRTKRPNINLGDFTITLRSDLVQVIVDPRPVSAKSYKLAMRVFSYIQQVFGQSSFETRL